MKQPGDTTRLDLRVGLRTYTALLTEAPALLRRIADDLEATPDAALVGMWVTGFAGPDELDIQVVVDDTDARSAQ